MSPITWGPLRHEPHQTPGQRFLQRLAVEVLFLGRVQRHHPAGMVDGPGAIAAAGGDRRAEGILQGAAFERRIDAGMRNGAGEIRGQDRALVALTSVARSARAEAILPTPPR